MRVLVSLPVHEQAAVVRDQLKNIFHYLEDPLVVLHVSADFAIDPDSLVSSRRVIVNPQRFRTAWGSGVLAKVHLSNLAYALHAGEFDYAVLAASNELCVRAGLESHLRQFDAGCTRFDLSTWLWKANCELDRPLRRLLSRHDLDAPVAAQVEGTFFARPILQRVLALLEPVDAATPWHHRRLSSSDTPWQDVRFTRTRHPPQSGPGARARLLHLARTTGLPRRIHRALCLGGLMPVSYPREEVYFATALDICKPDRLAGGLTYMNWARGLELSRDEIDAIRGGRLDLLPPGGLHNPGDSLFSVKKIPRDLDAPLRRYAGELRKEDAASG